MASEAEEKARRVRSLLSSYYGSSGDAPFAPGARAVPLEPIDAPDFDADLYVRETLERTPLDALREKCALMREEARRLDGDAQTLVYENYSKFIAATDTVRDVRVNARAMEETMNKAKSLMRTTVEKAHEVDKNLSLRRDQVLALSGVRNLIAKLQNAFDVPEKMRAALDKNAPSLAANYYAAVRPLLIKHGDSGAFVAVKKEAEKEAERARQMLFEAMRLAATEAAEAAKKRRDADRDEGPFTSPKSEEEVETNAKTDTEGDVLGGQKEIPRSLNLSASECVLLLEKLGAPRRESRAAFVRAHAAPMERALLSNESFVSSAEERRKIHADPRAFVAKLDGDFLEAFHRFAGEYLEVFGNDDGESSIGEPVRLVDAARPLFVRYFDALKLALDASADSSTSRDEDETIPRDTDDDEIPSSSTPPLVPAKGLMAALATMAADLSSAHRLVPKLGLGDRAAEVVERAVRGRVGAAFFVLEQKLANALDELEDVVNRASERNKGSSTPSTSLRDVHQPLKASTARVAAYFAGGVAEALDDARSLLEERPVMVMGWRAEFEGLVRAKSQTVLQATLARLAAAAARGDGAYGQMVTPKALRAERDDASPLLASKKDPKFDPLFALACASFAAFVRDEGVSLLDARLDACFPTRQNETRNDETGYPYDASTSSRFLAPSKKRAGEACLFLASAYARAKSDTLVAMLRRTTNNVDWAEAKEPRDVRLVADAMLEEVAAVDAEAATFLSSEKVETVKGTAGYSMRYAPRAATRAAVTASVVRFALRAFSEIVSATNRFSRGGFRQVALDLEYLKPRLVAFGASSSPADAKAVEDLLNECVAAAAARSLDPAPLDPAIIARILDAKQSRGGG